MNWVGYGNSTLTGSREISQRRIGYNQIYGTFNHTDADGSSRKLIVWQAPEAKIEINSALSGHGDSGAGVFNDEGEVIGVVSSISRSAFEYNAGEGRVYRSYAADLSDDLVRSWILDNI